MSERLTPHRIGNNGEAPFDVPFDAKPIGTQLRHIAWEIDAIHSRAMHYENLPGLVDTLAEIAERIDAYERDHGTAI